MAMKETIDIEALLYRAYAQYRVDKVGQGAAARMIGLAGAPVLSQPSWQPRVDTSAPGSRLAARASEVSSVPDDLLALHDRVLALADLWFAWAGDDVAVWDKATAAEVGCTIEKAADAWWLVRNGEPVERLEQAGVMVLVIQHARDGTRPDVHPDYSKRVGRRPADAAAHDHRGRRRKGEPVSQREVQHDRACYHAWRCALTLLQIESEGMLDSYRVTGPLAPAAPWLAVSSAEVESAAIRQNVMTSNAMISQD
ncbi:hypothetical protein LJR009_001609 [Bosea sp. LjRoot9]|uniref:hypothetical protein n=1 Tax=Bosea sp. LjRoot9 TaxID=3342341 RepID=UPI003ECE4AE8